MSNHLSAVKIPTNTASRYWSAIAIDAAGRRQVREITTAKAFFLESFPDFTPDTQVSDTQVQRQLWYWMHEAEGAGGAGDACRDAPWRVWEADQSSIAQLCLKCFMSGQIDYVCRGLASRFGAEHGFTSTDLLPFVLDEDIGKPRRHSPTYQSFLDEILQSFDPEQSSLATWTTRLVKHHKPLNQFLLEHGIYLVSDWAILNDTKPKQLHRIFAEFHNLTPPEIQHAQQLLEAYHAIYRSQRLKQRLAGVKGKCHPPTPEQLQQMAQCLSLPLRPETLLSQLQLIASRLREYRIYVRGGKLKSQSLDATPNEPIDIPYSEPTPDQQSEFLTAYRQQFLKGLDTAIAQITGDRTRKLQRRDSQKAQQFLTALHLFHCQGQSMSDIARNFNYKGQFQISRLLKLKVLRADIQRELLVYLSDRILEKAQRYTNRQRLQTVHQQIQDAIAEQVTQVIEEAATEASTATNERHHKTRSLFTQRLCLYLDNRSNIS
ncbi:hypothetical protein [Coleofasciculus sp.]|uniref:hypothetical protein n=1 Tax=Coleofasciculus sp. TaxID=3100458 RepID=UPI003A139976